MPQKSFNSFSHPCSRFCKEISFAIYFRFDAVKKQCSRVCAQKIEVHLFIVLFFFSLRCERRTYFFYFHRMFSLRGRPTRRTDGPAARESFLSFIVLGVRVREKKTTKRRKREPLQPPPPPPPFHDYYPAYSPCCWQKTAFFSPPFIRLLQYSTARKREGRGRE